MRTDSDRCSATSLSVLAPADEIEHLALANGQERLSGVVAAGDTSG